MPAARSWRIRLVAVGVGASLATALTLSTFASAGGSPPGKARNAHPKGTLTCTIKLIAVKPPRTINAENFGEIDCSPYLGKGVQHDSSVVTPTGQFSGHFTGPVKQFFDRGTLFGQFTISYVTNPTTLAVTYDGTITIEGGTGRYKNLRGTGTLQGSSPDAIRSTITEVLTLTHK